MTEPTEALARLKEGNARFVAHESTPRLNTQERASLVGGQQPFAVVLGCSDSRVPTELVFDQGPGELFVIRVAGNIVAPSQVGSVEFAAQKFNTRLVVVLGHTGCGAIEATIDELQRPAAKQSRNIAAIVNRVRPSVENLLQQGDISDRDELVHAAVRENVCYSVDGLRHGSEIVESLVADGDLLVVGAVYSLETGAVEFLDLSS